MYRVGSKKIKSQWTAKAAQPKLTIQIDWHRKSTDSRTQKITVHKPDSHCSMINLLANRVEEGTFSQNKIGAVKHAELPSASPAL